MKKYLSRKFLIAIILIALFIANKKFNLGIDNQTADAILKLALAYLGVEGINDLASIVCKKKD